MIFPKDTQYLFIDMNAFFASCEQQAHVAFRSKPLAVTPVNVATGCVISQSYEAKVYGVKTGILVAEAKRLCPKIIIRESDVNLYLQFHHQLIKILRSLSPFVVVKSIDEAVIKLSPSEQNSQAALAIANDLKAKIRSSLGNFMRASIGLGPNVWLAKMAAESQKPDGLVEVKLAGLTQFYQSLKLTDLKGIGYRLEKQLKCLGFYKPLDLYSSSAELLRKKLGLMGEYWFLRLHGYDIDKFIPKTKTIGHSHILEPAMRSWPRAWAVCQKLVEKAGRRLRAEGFVASGVHLWIRYLHQPAWHKGLKTSSFSDSQSFLRAIKKLWQEVPKETLPLGLGVRAHNLASQSMYQQKIFTKMQKTDQLYSAIDKINDKYGSFTIKPANILPAESSAPNRIAFGKPIF